jgi:hypothetical protein
MMIKNEPSRDLEAKLEAFVLPLRNHSNYVLRRPPNEPKEQSSLAEHLSKLSNGNLASSEDKIVDWLRGLEAMIQSSNCYSDYYSAWIFRLGQVLIRALINFVRQEGPSEKVVNACKNCLKATFEKIWGTSLTTNATEIKKTKQQQLESLERYDAAFGLLLDVASLVRETSVFDQNEVKLMVTRTAELLNFPPVDINLGNQRRENQEIFFRLVAGQIIPYMMGQKEIVWEDQIRNYPNALEEYLRPLRIDRPQTGLLIENFLFALAQEDGIKKLYEALQTQASGSQ